MTCRRVTHQASKSYAYKYIVSGTLSYNRILLILHLPPKIDETCMKPESQEKKLFHLGFGIRAARPAKPPSTTSPPPLLRPDPLSL
jgi:hypothetical protein